MNLDSNNPSYKFRLSPFTLSIFKGCPKCFWLHINKNHQRPRGIFPSLPGGMDLVIKDYFDKYRGSLPPELKGKVKGVLLDDLKTLKLWRHWQTSLRYEDENVSVYGAFDDVLIDNDVYIPLDYKTRSSPPNHYTLGYYLHQLDIYTLLLAQNQYPTENLAYLVYYYPVEVGEKGMVKFEVLPEKVTTSVERAKKLINEAVTVLKGPQPVSHRECEYCNWLSYFREFD